MDAVTSTAPVDDIGDRHIHGEGTPEGVWRAWNGLAALPPLTLTAFAPPKSRVVVVAPHPDDEVLGCGGTLSMLAAAGNEILVLGVTDGEASYAGSLQWPPGLLGRQRRNERLIGLRKLGLAGTPLVLGIPDGDIAAREETLELLLRDLVRPDDIVVTTWRRDGHPDHEAAGRAAASAAAACGCHCWEMPVWAWHWGSPGDVRIPWPRLRRINLDTAALSRKRDAIAAHASQLEPISREGRPAVLPDWALARLLRSFEVFIDCEEIS